MSLVGLCCALSCIFVVSCESPSGGDGGGSGGKTLDRIVITSQPAKITYIKGEELDLAGLVVTAYYSDNTSEPVAVTAANVTGYNKDTTGQQTLTITVSGKTATFTVTVTATARTLSSIAITTPPTKTSYRVDEALDTAGMVVTATYSDGGTAAVSNYTTSGFNSTAAAASQTVTVSYTEGGVTKTATFTVTITPAVGGNTITLYWVDAQGSLAFTNGAAATVSQTGTLTIAAQGTGYTGQIWFINGSETAANAGQSSYTFSGVGKEAGKQYVIGLRAAKDGTYYYAELVVSVTAPAAAQ